MVYDGERKAARVEYEVARHRRRQVMRGFSPIIAAALFASLMLSSACGGEEPRVAPTPAAGPAATPIPAETPAPAPTETRPPTNTVEPTQLPTTVPTAIPTATVPPQATTAPTSTPAPDPTPTPEATATPEPKATPKLTPTPTALPTPIPVPKPSAAPGRVRYQWDGSTILVSWDAVEGADYYRVYHDDLHGSSCRLEAGGESGFCESLADNVPATSYVHSEPDAQENYYWVIACNSGGCSDFDSENPAEGWSAADFLAEHHVIDGNLNFYVREDPRCTRDCEHSIYPGTGARDFRTVKATTGVDLGLMGPGKWSSMVWFRERISSGRIANGRVVLTGGDIQIAQDNDEYAVMFYIQRRAAPEWQLGGDVATLRDWYDGGLRVLQLAYGRSRPDATGPGERLGYGSDEGDELGVTDLGRAAIAEMNALGMIVDVSHCNKQTTLDAAALSAKPIIATHSNAEALTAHRRNKSDEELLAIAATGGVIGVTPIRRFLDTDGDGAAGMDDMIAHIEYMVELVGIDHVAVATDARMDGWEPSSYYYTDSDLGSLDRWVRLASRLYARGWTEEDLAKLLGGNLRRVFAEVLAER